MSRHQVIELELLTVMVALLVWYCQRVFYLDNQAARGAVIHGPTPRYNGGWLVRTFTVRVMQNQLKMWFVRFPTISNVTSKSS